MADANKALFYHVEDTCNGLPCPPYDLRRISHVLSLLSDQSINNDSQNCEQLKHHTYICCSNIYVGVCVVYVD